VLIHVFRLARKDLNGRGFLAKENVFHLAQFLPGRQAVRPRYADVLPFSIGVHFDTEQHTSPVNAIEYSRAVVPSLAQPNRWDVSYCRACFLRCVFHLLRSEIENSPNKRNEIGHHTIRNARRRIPILFLSTLILKTV
jgi:hypothetical protein